MTENKKRPGKLGGEPVFPESNKSSLAKHSLFGERSLVSEYSMLREALQLGGIYTGSIGADFPRAGDEYGKVAAGEGWRASLSTAHISPGIIEKLPFVEYYDGASIFKASSGGTGEQIGGGIRGQIDGFSWASRRRLMQTIGKVKRDADLPAFVTLTYPGEFPTDPCEVKRHLDIFFKRVKRKFRGEVGAIWKMEPQERGAAHFHILVWGADFDTLREFVPAAWYEIAGAGDGNHFLWHCGVLGNGNQHCVQQVKSFAGVWSYAAKYLGKSFEIAGWQNVGRFWGVINRGKIPFGEKIIIEVNKAKSTVVMRYQRRFMRVSRQGKLRKKISARGKSLTIFCDASQWANRLL